MITVNDTQKAFDSLQSSLPTKWISPKLDYIRWTNQRRSYYSPQFKDLKIEETDLRTVLSALTSGKPTPEASSLLNAVHSNYVNELIRVLRNSLEDKTKKRNHIASIAATKVAAKERKVKARIVAKEMAEKAKAAQKAKKNAANERKKKLAAKNKAIAVKNATLMKALFLTPEQKAILKQIAG